jgi:hypothetical protein
MLLYEDYFPCNTSPLFLHTPIPDTTVYDIILLPSRTQQNLKQQYTSTANWLDNSLVSRLKNEFFFFCNQNQTSMIK